MKQANILGAKYDIYFLSENEFEMHDATGYCERWSKEIFINQDLFLPTVQDAAKNIELAKYKTVRHELFHALFHEAGLSEYAEDETLVEALACLYPKIEQLFKELEVEE